MVDLTEKIGLDTVYKAFQPYIQEHTYFDILYSDKIGYVRLLVQEEQEEEAIRIRTAKEMLDTLFHEILLDVLLSPDRKKLSDNAIDECRIKIRTLIGGMDESEEVMTYFERYIQECLRNWNKI